MAARIAISLASRSRCPSRWRSCRTRPMRRSISPTALAVVHGNGATAEIAQVLHLAEQVFSTRPQLLQRLIHSASNLNDYTHSDYRPKKERAQLEVTPIPTRVVPRAEGLDESSDP